MAQQQLASTAARRDERPGAAGARPRVALVLVYNHRFEKNIDLLESIYAGRFAAIFHVMPFYRGARPNVIGVYEHSHQFQGYFAQALPRIYDPQFTHYVLAGDDLLLNPALDQDNLHERLGATPEQGYIKTLLPASSLAFHWPHLYKTMHELRAVPGVEASGELPRPDEARQLLRERHGVDVGEIGWRNLSRGYYSVSLPPDAADTPAERLPKAPMRRVRLMGRCASMLLSHDIARLRKQASGPLLPFPLLMSYSDLVMVPAADAQEFARYCGVFAAMRIFVEMAVPTALALACQSVLTERDAKMQGQEFWDDERSVLEARHGYDLASLAASYSDRLLYVHPVKLSAWHGVFAAPAARAAA